MPAMKLTPNAAMRARDVSRPRAEHLAQAEAAEARGSAAPESTGRAERRGAERGNPAPGGTETGRAETGRSEAGRGKTGETTAEGRAGRPGFPRRRRGPRDGGRRGRSSR
jgi:hypothetical protein